MKQQTAVEWFFMTMNIRGLLPNKEIVECYKEAKAMEKEQIMKAFYKGRQEEQYKNLFNNHVRKSEEQYYKETYESKTNL
jgi:hypothetical protein